MIDEFIGYDATALGELIRKGEITPFELLEVTIQRIEKINPQLNAVIHKMYDSARETAESWSSKIKAGKVTKAIFCGIPFLLKDLIAEYKKAPFHERSCAVSKTRQVSPQCLCHYIGMKRIYLSVFNLRDVLEMKPHFSDWQHN